MLLSTTTLFTLLASVSVANATFARGLTFSWGCDQDTRDRAPAPVKNDCSGRGSFFTSRGGDPVCCSDKTRVPPPKDDDCPHTWAWNGRASCCIPPKEVCEKDCGEGYVFDKITMKCKRKEINKCGSGKWWHDRGKECCDFNWQPDKGNCPPGKTCPKEWHWSKKDSKCKPDTPRTPEPGCDNWNESHGCCGGPPPQPSPAAPKPPTTPPASPPKTPLTPKPPTKRGYPTNDDNDDDNSDHNGGLHKRSIGTRVNSNGHGHKRNIDLRRSSQIAFPQSETDKMYCPGNLHACSVNTIVGGEWSYECIDFSTELESCGGCASTGDGQDCTKIPNAAAVGCEAGSCAVYSCQVGFAANGTSCATIL